MRICERRAERRRTFAPAAAILAVPQHLQQPVGTAQHQKNREQRTVERVH